MKFFSLIIAAVLFQQADFLPLTNSTAKISEVKTSVSFQKFNPSTIDHFVAQLKHVNEYDLTEDEIHYVSEQWLEAWNTSISKYSFNISCNEVSAIHFQTIALQPVSNGSAVEAFRVSSSAKVGECEGLTTTYEDCVQVLTALVHAIQVYMQGTDETFQSYKRTDALHFNSSKVCSRMYELKSE